MVAFLGSPRGAIETRDGKGKLQSSKRWAVWGIYTLRAVMPGLPIFRTMIETENSHFNLRKKSVNVDGKG